MRRFPTNIQNLLLLGLGFPIVALNVWVLSQFFRYFEHLITILTIAALVAFLLNYPVKLLEQVHFRRLPAILCVLLITLTLLIILGVTVVPNAIEQTTELLKQVPEWIRASNENINAWEEWGKGKGLQLDFNVLRSQINAKIDTQLQIIGAEVVGLAVVLFLELSIRCRLSYCRSICCYMAIACGWESLRYCPIALGYP